MTMKRVVAAVVLAGFLIIPALPAVAATPGCAEQAAPASCDSDGDRISDVLEVAVCGTAMCASGREDADRDGIADWSEFIVCGTATCANSKMDTDGDGIPDFAEIYVCGSAVCSTGREDVDGDRVADWVEFVICGDRYCANGSEDFDADGISDALQLAACVVALGVSAVPGVLARPVVSGTVQAGTVRVVLEWVWWPILVGGLLALLGLLLLGVALWRQHKRDQDHDSAAVASAVEVDELLGLNQ